MAFNYRKAYEGYLGYKLTSDIDVHHIDHNRANNAVSNLVAIPKSLHKKYHLYFRIYNDSVMQRDSECKKIPFISNIEKELNELRTIAKEYGLHSFKMMYATQRLAEKSVSLLQSKSSYDTYNADCMKYWDILSEYKKEILAIKKVQDNQANKSQKQLGNN